MLRIRVGSLAGVLLLLAGTLAACSGEADESDASAEDRFLLRAYGSAYIETGVITLEDWECIEAEVLASGTVGPYGEFIDRQGFESEEEIDEWVAESFAIGEVDGLAGLSEPMAAFEEAMLRAFTSGCVSEEALVELGSDPGVDRPFGPGDEPTMDALAEACVDGSSYECDLLWLLSAPESEYERIANTCGRADGQPADPERWCQDQNDDSVSVDRMIDDCYDGMAASCDLLYEVTFPGTPERTISLTCGDRQAETDPPLCILRLGILLD